MAISTVPVDWMQWNSRAVVHVDRALDENGDLRRDKNGREVVQAHVLIVALGMTPQVIKIRVTEQAYADVEVLLNQQVALVGLEARAWAISREKHGMSFTVPAVRLMSKEKV